MGRVDELADYLPVGENKLDLVGVFTLPTGASHYDRGTVSAVLPVLSNRLLMYVEDPFGHRATFL